MLALLVAGCGGGSGSTGMTSGMPGTAKGFAFSPKSTSLADLTDFWQRCQQTGKMVTWSGDWNELQDTVNGSPAKICQTAGTYGMSAIVIATFFNTGDGSLLRPFDATNKANYKTYAVNFAQAISPQYIGFGIEINTLHEKDLATYNDFIPYFAEVYDAVKAVSPTTRIFTVFQLEKMKGLNGGLFGGVNDPSANTWFLIADFPKADISVFTTYPCIIYGAPADMPVDYYTEIGTHTTKPLAISESGWFMGNTIAGWESSEAEQAEFVTKFFAIMPAREFMIWSFMYDPAAAAPFDSLGLINNDGSPRTGYTNWKNGQ